MNESYYMVFYWGDRKEDICECVNRTVMLIQKLSSLDNFYSDWYMGGMSRKKALKNRIAINDDSIREIFIRSRNTNDIDGHTLDNLGYTLGLWNGRKEEESVGISISCSIHAENINLMNSCIISFPEASSAAGKRLLNTSFIRKLLELVVEVWEPDWGVVTSHQFRRHINPVPRVPFVAWFLYLSERRGVIPQLPDCVSVFRLDDYGNVIQTVDELFCLRNDAHINIAEEITKRLNKSDLLAPTVLCVG